MGDYQFGVGVVSNDTETPGSIGDVLGPDTVAGQAALVAMLGLAILFLTVPGRGVVGRVGAVLQMLIVVASAAWAANYFARMYAARHPNGPLAAGMRFDA